MLWAGEIEDCDFDLYGGRIVTDVVLYTRDYYRGFLVYLQPAGQ